MNVSVEQEEKTNYELGPGFTKDARSCHHVEKVMSRILARQRVHSKTTPLWPTEPEDCETDDRWH